MGEGLARVLIDTRQQTGKKKVESVLQDFSLSGSRKVSVLELEKGLVRWCRGSGARGRRVICLHARGGTGGRAAYSWKCLLGTFLVQTPHWTGKGSGQDVCSPLTTTLVIYAPPPLGSFINSTTAHPDQSPRVLTDFLLSRDG